jgi:hypothetical protein
MRTVAASLAIFAATILRGAGLPKMDALSDDERSSKIGLTTAEMKEIVVQINAEGGEPLKKEEMRIRRVSLGMAAGLIVRASGNYFCSPTGNCLTWAFRKDHGRWVAMFTGLAPEAQTFGLEQQTSHGIRNLVLGMHASATQQDYTVWAFDGRTYVPSRCFSVTYPEDGGKPETTEGNCR